MNALVLAILLLFISEVVYSEEAKTPPKGVSAIQIGTQSYWLDPQKFILGHTISTMAAGYPIGEESNSIEKRATIKSVSEMKERIAKENKQSLEKINMSKDVIRRIQKNINESNDLSEKSDIADVDVVALNKNIDFNSCAQKALVLLKQKIRLEFILSDKKISALERDTAVSAKNAVLTQLQEGRGIGGLACAYGDKLIDSVAVVGDIDQQRVLMALLSRQGAERKILKQALALAYGPKYKKYSVAWLPIWKHLALRAVFSTKPLPSVQSLEGQLNIPDPGRTSSLSDGAARVTANIKLDTKDFGKMVYEGLNAVGGGNEKN